MQPTACHLIDPTMFSLFARGRRFVAPAILAAFAIQACDNSVTVGPITNVPAFSLSLGSSALSVSAGGTTSTSIKATRSGNLVGTIAYLVADAPPGLTVIVFETSEPDSVTLAVTAATTVTPGNYSIVVTAAAAGAASHDAAVSVTVRAVTDVDPQIAFVALGEHSCALTTAGAAYCWGYNANGALGNGNTDVVTSTPTAVAGDLTFKSIAVAKVEEFTCGLTITGDAYCWGKNDGGQLGDGTTTRRLTPTRVVGGLTFKSLAVGAAHACGITAGGITYCWGTSPNGAFGNGSVGMQLTPTPIAPGAAFASVTAGSDFTCGLSTDGTAFCWGLGFLGQLGDGHRASSTTPVRVAGDLKFLTLSAGGQTVCGLTTNGAAYCWGQNSFGSVGDGSKQLRATPVAVAGGLTFQSIAAGYETMCGVTSAGDGYCWGYNFGAVGDGSEDAVTSPSRVAGGLTFQTVVSGTGHSCGVTIAMAVYCWGDNSDGELGDGTISPHATPQPVRWR